MLHLSYCKFCIYTYPVNLKFTIWHPPLPDLQMNINRHYNITHFYWHERSIMYRLNCEKEKWSVATTLQGIRTRFCHVKHSYEWCTVRVTFINEVFTSTFVWKKFYAIFRVWTFNLATQAISPLVKFTWNFSRETSVKWNSRGKIHVKFTSWTWNSHAAILPVYNTSQNRI